MMQKREIKCITQDCPGKEFALVTIEKGKMTVVNEAGHVIRDTTKWIYKCLTCQRMIETDIPPSNPKILHG